MTTYPASQIVGVIQSAKVGVVTLSGTVLVGGNGVPRDIKIYKNNAWTFPWELTSEADGSWTVDVEGGSNDKFTIICVGETGEWSGIYDKVIEL